MRIQGARQQDKVRFWDPHLGASGSRVLWSKCEWGRLPFCSPALPTTDCVQGEKRPYF